MKDHNLGYISGIIDGEGFVGFTNYKRPGRPSNNNNIQIRPEISISNTNKGLMEYVVKIIENITGNNHNYYTKKEVPGNKPIHELKIRNKDSLLKIIRSINLVAKRKQSELVLEFLERKNHRYCPKDFDLNKKCKELNKRGGDMNGNN